MVCDILVILEISAFHANFRGFDVNLVIFVILGILQVLGYFLLF